MKLERRIRRDLKEIGAKELDFTLELRGYSKTYDGRYDPNNKTVIIYERETDNMIRDYEEIMDIAIHEFIHHLQWEHDPNFVRYRGIMHNEDFFHKYKMYKKRWDRLNENRRLEQIDKYNKFNIRDNKGICSKDMGEISRLWI